MRPALGHEFVADDAFLHTPRATAAPSAEDIKNFKEGNISAIKINTTQKGNSYQDIILTRIGYLLAERIEDKTIKTKEDLARWLKMAITPGGTETIKKGDIFYRDKLFIQKMYEDFNKNIPEKAKNAPGMNLKR